MKILVAYDGSDGARRGLDVVAGLATHEDAISVVAVSEGVPLFGYAGAPPSPEQEEERPNQLVEAAMLLSEHGLQSALVNAPAIRRRRYSTSRETRTSRSS